MDQKEFMKGMLRIQDELSPADRENLYSAMLYVTDLGKWQAAVKIFGPGVWTALETSTNLNRYVNQIQPDKREAIMGLLERTVKDLARDFAAAEAPKYHSLLGEMKAQYC